MEDVDHLSTSAAAPEGTDILSQLVAKARDGDRDAFEKLMELFQARIFRMIYYRTGSRMDAEDMTQEIFLQAYRKLAGLREVDRFQSWLFSIAMNRLRDFRRKKMVLSLFGTLEGDDDAKLLEPPLHHDQTALDSLLREEFWNRVKQLTEQFSRWEREIFLLRFLDHLSIKEIAQVLRKSESAVKTHLYRAVKKFKEHQSLAELLERDRHG